MRGGVGLATLPRVVRDLWMERASGTLQLSSGTIAKQISFRRGDIVFAATNVNNERLGERLVRSGSITRSVLDLAFRVVERSNERLGKTIVDLGWLSSEDLQQHVAGQVKDIVFSVFNWEFGMYRFEPSPEPVAFDLILKLRTAEVIWEGANRISNMTAIRAGVGDERGRLRLRGGRHLAIPIGQNEGRIISRVDGRATIADIVASFPELEEETLRRIYALLLAGVLEVHGYASAADIAAAADSDAAVGPDLADADAQVADVAGGQEQAPDDDAMPGEDEQAFRDGIIARHAALGFGNFYDRLGVGVGASDDAIRVAHEEVMRSIEPAPHYAHRLEDLQKRLDLVKLKVEEAFKALSDNRRRRAYDLSIGQALSSATIAPGVESATSDLPDASSTMASAAHLRVDVAPEPSTDPEPEVPAALDSPTKKQEQAEFRFARAERHIADGDYFDAIAAADEAVRLDPNKARYHRLLAQLLSENPSCQESAMEHYERAIELEPDDAEVRVRLATLYEEAGIRSKAQRAYETILTLDPGNAVALQKLGQK